MTGSSMFWIIFGTIFFIVAIAVIVWIYFKDRRYEEKSVAETMSPQTWDDIAREREENLLKAKKFKEVLDRARSKQL